MILILGYIVTSSSSYVEVDQLSSYSRDSFVSVRAKVADVEIFSKKNRIVFVLEGSKWLVNASYSLNKFVDQYGGMPTHSMVGQEMVVRGVFHPLRKGRFLGWIDVSSILRGCHKAYESPPAEG